MLAGKMIRFSDSSVLFVLWVVCVGGGCFCLPKLCGIPKRLEG